MSVGKNFNVGWQKKLMSVGKYFNVGWQSFNVG
jgi:hypothetical protein